MRFILMVSSVLLLAAAPAEAPTPRPSAEALSWLAGCWASVGGEPGSGEQWMPPAGGSLLGVSRTVRGGKTVAYEFLQIRELDAGGLAYIATPSGQRETVFPLVRLSRNEAVFENPTHDFPQRIIYRLEPEGRLLARIEGRRGEQVKAVDFPMLRTSCGAERK